MTNKEKLFEILKNPMGKTICIDLDNTICAGTYWLGQEHPLIDESFAKIVRYLDDKGAFINVWTARPLKAVSVTYKWLGENNLQYPLALRIKPPCDLMIDDKALNKDDVVEFMDKMK